MKNCAVICEFNPFHSGHLHLLSEVRSLGFDNTLCIMSGAFTQNAKPAYFAKDIRAKAALLGGADAVIELPTAYAVNVGENFARGGVRIAASIKDTTALAFGHTCKNPNILLKIAEAQLKRKDDIKAALKDNLDTGASFASAYASATAKIMNSDEAFNALNEPNNMLGVQYLKAIIGENLNINPVFINRVGAGFHDTSINSEFVSATAIRSLLDGDSESAYSYLPFLKDEHRASFSRHKPNMSVFGTLLLNAIRNADPDYLASLEDSSEGIEKRLISAAEGECDYLNMLSKAKTKRYTYRRLERLCFQALVGQTKSCEYEPLYTRLLAAKSAFPISILPCNIIKDNRTLRALKISKENILNIDIRAANVYSLVTNTNKSYFDYSIIKI